MKRFSCTVNENKYFANSIEMLKNAIQGTEIEDALFTEEEGEFSVPKAARDKKIAHSVYVLVPQS